jgi:hypothetical protein
VGGGRRAAKELSVCCRDQKKNGSNRSINKASKIAKVKRR